MIDGPVLSKDSVVVLYIGGRLPSWHALSAEEQKADSDEHVELMLSVAKKHGMMQLEGYKLMAPIGTYQRFWPIEFPDLAGDEASVRPLWPLRVLSGQTMGQGVLRHLGHQPSCS